MKALNRAAFSWRKTLSWTAGGLAVAAIVGMLTVYSYNQGKAQADPQNVQYTVSGAVVDENAAYQYILRAQNGRLAVFLKDGQESEMTFDTPVRTLPEYDQRLLEEGIRVADYPTLIKLIDDYIS